MLNQQLMGLRRHSLDTVLSVRKYNGERATLSVCVFTRGVESAAPRGAAMGCVVNVNIVESKTTLAQLCNC